MNLQVGNAPCSWGNLEFESLAQQSDYQKMLDEMASSGYVGTELGDWGLLPTTPAALRESLSPYNLAMIGGFVPVALADASAHPAGVELALETARLMAAVNPQALVVLADDNGTVEARTRNAGRINSGHGLGSEEWDHFVTGAHRVAQAVKDETGLATVFHHHCAGYIETPEEIATLMERTDPDLIGLCLDTGHCHFGGGDSVSVLRQYATRIRHVHLKDCCDGVADSARKQGLDYFQALGSGVFCELGEGGVDFPALFDELDGLGYSGWLVVEQDILPGQGSPLGSAQKSRAYLRTHGL